MWLAPETIATNYFNFVKRCLTDESAFSSFKQTNDYVSVVGMSEDWQAPSFYSKIQEYPLIFSRFNDFKKNDWIGTPPLTVLDGHSVSPNTLRHIKTLCDLHHHFGNLNEKVIAELGVGYGGTAFMTNTFYPNLLAYHLIDVPEVQQFALKYLSAMGVTKATSEVPVNIDVFISEYCLSEFDDNQMYDYYEKYVKHSKNAYLMMNLHDEDRKQKFINHMSKDFNVEILPEYPVTRWPNYILIGKK